jgi:alanine racemase
MVPVESLNRVIISRSALSHNFRVCREQAGGADVMAMVKADGYGHGMLECARVFAECGAAAFGVAEVVEGVTLRQSGITQPVFVLTASLPEFFPAIIEYNLTPILVDADQVNAISVYTRHCREPLPVHIKIDAGMGRQGCLLAELPGLVELIEKTTGLRCAGIMAHFPMADDRDNPSNSKILADFKDAVGKLDGGDVASEKQCHHIANSGALFGVVGATMDMVRPGISLYGYGAGGAGLLEQQLCPAMSFVSKVIQIRTVPKEVGLGYGHTFITCRETRLAVLPVGYEDGYLRKLSGRAFVLIRGRRVPVVGRVSMNLTLVDVTELDSVQAGDEVVLLGRQGTEQITADDISVWMESISYEVLCLFGHCNKKEFVD